MVLFASRPSPGSRWALSRRPLPSARSHRPARGPVHFPTYCSATASKPQLASVSWELSQEGSKALPRSLCIKAATSADELVQAAWLRAEAYYETRQYGRFTRSFVRQFAQQEALNLQRRARLAAAEGGEGPPSWITLVAIEAAAAAGAAGAAALRETAEAAAAAAYGEAAAATAYGEAAAETEAAAVVVGTLDLRLASKEQLGTLQLAYSQEQLEDWVARLGGGGAPELGHAAAYLSNVVVAQHSRGRGVGGRLITAAKQATVEVLGARWVCAHVLADNEPALQLYRKYGFEPASEGLAAGAGRLLLVCCQL